MKDKLKIQKRVNSFFLKTEVTTPFTPTEIKYFLDAAAKHSIYKDHFVNTAIAVLPVPKEKPNEEQKKLFLSLINYLTTIAKSPTIDLKEEFSKVQKLFGEVFQDVDFDDEKNPNADNLGIIPALIKLTIIMEDVDFLNYLISTDHCFNGDFDNGENALHLAAKCKGPEIMNILLDALETAENFLELFVEKDTRSYTPLATAVLHVNLEAVKVLLDQNSKAVSKAKNVPDQRSSDYAFYSKTSVGQNVFDLAAISNNAELIQCLLKYSRVMGIPRYLLGNSGPIDNALEVAVTHESIIAAKIYLDFLKYMRKEDLDLSKYLSTVSLDKLAKTDNLHEILKYALESDKTLLSYKDYNGDSLLHLAVDSFNKQAVQILLEKGANIHERNIQKISVSTKLFNAVVGQIRIEDERKASIEKIFECLLHSKMFENADHSFNIGTLELFLKHNLTSNGQPSVFLKPFTTYLNNLARKFDDAQSEITDYESNLVKALFSCKVSMNDPVPQKELDELKKSSQTNSQQFKEDIKDLRKEEGKIFKLKGGIFEQAITTIDKNFSKALETLAEARIKYLEGTNSNISEGAKAELAKLTDTLKTWNQKKASEMHFFEGPGFNEGHHPEDGYSETSSSFAEKPQEESRYSMGAFNEDPMDIL